MNIFLTGGTGFIGSHFINKVQEAGHKVFAIRRNGSKPKVPLRQQPQWIEGDLSGDFRVFMKKSDTFIHLAAASANVPYESLDVCMHWNVVMTLKIFDQAYESGIRKFIAAGSCFEYGRSGERYEFIPVDAPLEPNATYPISKAAASVMLGGWARLRNCKLSYLRIFQVFGEGEAPNRFWPSLKVSAVRGDDFAMTRGEQIRDFINVKDVAKKLVGRLELDSVSNGNPFYDHIGTGDTKTLREFAEFWWREWEAQGRLRIGDIEYRDNEIMRYVPMIKD